MKISGLKFPTFIIKSATSRDSTLAYYVDRRGKNKELDVLFMFSLFFHENNLRKSGILTIKAIQKIKFYHPFELNQTNKYRLIHNIFYNDEYIRNKLDGYK